ncbi:MULTISPECIES: hypothetical protein [unclassified Halomonas]|uniref:hypothetical protein n=1 Tax=unclassified Halomonas TaxID=2609666 RepID=UPI0004826A7F|nr:MULTISPECIES: hypothetical protein [unclassified Halomonas]PKH60094.1 hypothetical protein CXF94_16390 [Halomonas sp. Choline-3u-9]QGQ72011.1 hypothetical protein FDY98_21760 [Halomonas sp. PA16-9]
MLFANSTPLLWLSYYGLSLLVIVAVYFALTFLPRLPRLVLTWMVAGAIWAPATFRLPLIEEGEFYTGWAPSAMVAAVGFLENNGAALRGGLMWLVLGMALGALIGVALWWWRRPGDDEYVAQEEESADESESPRRREPVIG